MLSPRYTCIPQYISISDDYLFNMTQKDKKIAIIGAGIAGCVCAQELAEHNDVEIFEAAEKDAPSRPLQMEGAVYYLDNIPELEPTYKINELVLASENEEASFKGDLGCLFRIGGVDGLDVEFKKEVEKKVRINYSSKITSLDMLSEFDIIIAADGHRSRISLMAKMRGKHAELTGLGLGLNVKGEFKPGYTYSLFDNNYAPGGYLYLIPINETEASLVTASIGSEFNSKKLRNKLRDHADHLDLEIVGEWTDIEKWYHFNTYQKDNIYVIGGAASFTDKTYGFGLKYSIMSARACADSILHGKDYNTLLTPVLKELHFWERMGDVLTKTTNAQQDTFVKMAKNPLVKWKIESGGSLHPYFRLLSGYLRIKNSMKKRYSSVGYFHPQRKLKLPTPER
jgi:flavin-dependent dehydrogenase